MIYDIIDIMNYPSLFIDKYTADIIESEIIETICVLFDNQIILTSSPILLTKINHIVNLLAQHSCPYSPYTLIPRNHITPFNTINKSLLSTNETPS